jgi:hypothetical protein
MIQGGFQGQNVLVPQNMIQGGFQGQNVLVPQNMIQTGFQGQNAQNIYQPNLQPQNVIKNYPFLPPNYQYIEPTNPYLVPQSINTNPSIYNQNTKQLLENQVITKVTELPLTPTPKVTENSLPPIPKVTELPLPPTPKVTEKVKASESPLPPTPKVTKPLLFARGAPCTSTGDCGQLGIFGTDLVCVKTGCQNCKIDTDCNGVNNPPGKCVDNLCSCVSDSDCSCEGNDPYGCGFDKNGKCTCSELHKGLATIKISPSKPLNTFYILGIGLLIILLWSIFIARFTKMNNEKAKKYIFIGSLIIFIVTVIISIFSSSS